MISATKPSGNRLQTTETIDSMKYYTPTRNPGPKPGKTSTLKHLTYLALWAATKRKWRPPMRTQITQTLKPALFAAALWLASGLTGHSQVFTVSCPADITVPASGLSGAVVNYSVPAIDVPFKCLPTSVTSNPASGSTFPVGTNTVTVAASDNCGNSATCSFQVIVNPPPSPQLVLSSTNAIIPAGGTNDFGSVLVDANAYGLFIITNGGGTPLSGLSITFDGSSDFTLFAFPQSSVDPGASTTFTVQFAPATAGPKTATLHIVSNDPQNDPYNVTLTGSATFLSPPRILSAIIVNQKQDVQVTWTTLGGNSYVLQVCTNADGSLHSNFVDCSPTNSIGGSGSGTTNYTHIGGALHRAAYYRVRTEP